MKSNLTKLILNSLSLIIIFIPHSCANPNLSTDKNTQLSQLSQPTVTNPLENKGYLEYEDYFEKLDSKQQDAYTVEIFERTKISPNGNWALAFKNKISAVYSDNVDNWWKIIQKNESDFGLVNINSGKFTPNINSGKINKEFNFNYFWVDNENYFIIYITKIPYDIKFNIKILNFNIKNNQFTTIIDENSKNFNYLYKNSILYFFTDTQFSKINFNPFLKRTISDYKTKIFDNTFPEKIYDASEDGNSISFLVKGENLYSEINLYTLNFFTQKILPTKFDKNNLIDPCETCVFHQFKPKDEKYITFYTKKSIHDNVGRELTIELHNSNSINQENSISSKFFHSNNLYLVPSPYLPEEIYWLDENKFLSLPNTSYVSFNNLTEYTIDKNRIKGDISIRSAYALGINEKKDVFYLQKSGNDLILIAKNNSNENIIKTWKNSILASDSIYLNNNNIWIELIDQENNFISYHIDLNFYKVNEIFKRKVKIENLTLTQNNAEKWKVISIGMNNPDSNGLC